jgi:hypothetical protein
MRMYLLKTNVRPLPLANKATVYFDTFEDVIQRDKDVAGLTLFGLSLGRLGARDRIMSRLMPRPAPG